MRIKEIRKQMKACGDLSRIEFGRGSYIKVGKGCVTINVAEGFPT